MDNGVGLLDTRLGTAMAKTILRMRSNAIRFNPMEPLNFVVANEDHNLYGFDVRNLHRPTKIYKGHTSAVLDVSFNPTGREFVTASYDKTLRIFPTDRGASRDVYHTRRMQRVMVVDYTLDSQYVLSGSDDGNLRLWKSNASASTGKVLHRREEAALRYRQSLQTKYRHTDEVRTIARQRNLPKWIR